MEQVSSLGQELETQNKQIAFQVSIYQIRSIPFLPLPNPTCIAASPTYLSETFLGTPVPCTLTYLRLGR